MEKYTLEYYEPVSDIEENYNITSIIELEENYIALCTVKHIKVFFYNGKEYSEYMKVIVDNIFYLIYTKDKRLVSQSDNQLKIFDLNLKDKSYNLLQTIDLSGAPINLKILRLLIKKDTTTGRPIELSNGNIVTSNFYQLVLIEKLDVNDYYKPYQISTFSKLGQQEIDCIIECSNTEICASSKYDELIGFFNKKTLKCTSYTYCVNDGAGALCMVNKELMLAINIHGEGFSLIDVKTHEIIKKTRENELNKLCLYAIKISENEILMACQEKWKNWVESVKYQLGVYKYVPFKEVPPLYLRHLILNKEDEWFHNNGDLKITGIESLNVLLYLKNKHIVISFPYIGIREEENEEGEEDLMGTVEIYKMNEDKRNEDIKKEEEREKEEILQIKNQFQNKDFIKKLFEDVAKNEDIINYEQFKIILKNIAEKFALPECNEELAKEFFQAYQDNNEKMNFEKFNEFCEVFTELD